MRLQSRLLLPLVLPFLLGSAAALATTAGQPLTVGWIERVRVGAEGLVVQAKLDTGADVSSLHATSIRVSRRADGNWVSFDVTAEDRRVVHFERRVERIARVRRASGGVQERPVVLLGICLGPVYKVAEVNLTDRGAFTMPLLVGRNFLAAGEFLIDSRHIDTIEPSCKLPAASRSPTADRYPS